MLGFVLSSSTSIRFKEGKGIVWTKPSIKIVRPLTEIVFSSSKLFSVEVRSLCVGSNATFLKPVNYLFCYRVLDLRKITPLCNRSLHCNTKSFQSYEYLNNFTYLPTISWTLYWSKDIFFKYSFVDLCN